MKKIILVSLMVSMLVLSVVLVSCSGPLAGEAIATQSTLNKGETILLPLDNTGGVEVLEYKGADSSSEKDGEVAFKRLGTGTTVKFPIIGNEITITLGGEFPIQLY